MSQPVRRYKIPARTVQLGIVLDLYIDTCVNRQASRIFIEDWQGWLLTIPEHGFELEPGQSKLFLFKPRDEQQTEAEPGSAAERAYRLWHQRNADAVAKYEVPDQVGHYQGRVRMIGYRSDKWHGKGKSVDYDHDFLEGDATAPKLYTDHPGIDESTAAVIVGGDMTITERGIA